MESTSVIQQQGPPKDPIRGKCPKISQKWLEKNPSDPTTLAKSHCVVCFSQPIGFGKQDISLALDFYRETSSQNKNKSRHPRTTIF